MLIYCDSAVLIYFLDHAGPLQARATARLDALWLAGDQVAVSDLTRLECRVRPLQRGDTAALARWDGFFRQPDVRIVPLTGSVYDRAAAIRAAYNFTTLDSIHLAAALETGCHHFLTNDSRLNGFTELTVEVLA